VEGPAKSVIHIYLPGGMAHQESFDPKPYAPLEYRGPFKSIKTKIPGVHFSENFKETAKIADKITVCRSMTHGEAAHERGTHNMFTGYKPSPAIKFQVLVRLFLMSTVPAKTFLLMFAFPMCPMSLPGVGT
jgi:hypothetical protein